MHSNMTEISCTAYFNDIINRFYEDERVVKKFGNDLGFHVEQDYFLAVTFLYPSTSKATYEDKELLKAKLSEIQSLPEMNKNIHENQLLYIGHGVVMFLIGHSREDIMRVMPAYKEEVSEIVENINSNSDKKVRIGIGIAEKGISGICKTYNYAKNAVRAGEIFKKERTVLEYMGMEIYSSINAMVTNYGERITDIVFTQIDEKSQRILAKYYKCKEDISETAKAMGMDQEEVEAALATVKQNTGLDVNDTEDSFKLHLLTIAKKVLDTNKKIAQADQENEI